MSDEESNQKAGPPPGSKCLPAVKAGGMRIVQHKTPNTERPAKAEQEDATGLTSQPNVTPTTGVQDKGLSCYTASAVKVAHEPKCEKNVAPPRVHNINQPRK